MKPVTFEPSRLPSAALSRIVALVSLIGAAVYLGWRLFSTSSGANPVLFALLFAVDLTLVAIHMLQMLPFVALKRRASDEQVRHAPPTDVVLIVGDEPLIQIRIALRAALELRGSEMISVLNTYGRPDVLKACKRLKVHHLSGSGTESVGRLASDLVARTRAEFCVVLPGALWVDPDLAILVRPSFSDPKVGMVSHPAVVTGNAGLVGGDGYRATSDADGSYASQLDGANAAPAMEGPAVFRREALRSLKGFATGSARFVLHTQLALSAAGWTSRYADVPGAYRPADWDEDQALRGRARLMAGRLSVTAQPDMGWRPKGAHRWAQSSHVLALLELWSVVARMVAYVMVPVVALTGRLPLTTSIVEAIVFAGGWFTLRGLARRLVLRVEQPAAADIRRGARLLATDLSVLKEQGSDEVSKPGKSSAAQAWATLALLVAAAIGAFSQALGKTLQQLPELAHATLICASVAMVWLARDSSWAVADRQHRVLPRARFNATERGQVLEASPFGIDIIGHFLPGAEMVVPTTLPLPAGRRWQANLLAVVARTGMYEGTEVSYLQFDLDERALDELGYYCAVTAPTLERLGHVVRPFGFPQPTGKTRSDPMRPPDRMTFDPVVGRPNSATLR